MYSSRNRDEPLDGQHWAQTMQLKIFTNIEQALSVEDPRYFPAELLIGSVGERRVIKAHSEHAKQFSRYRYNQSPCTVPVLAGLLAKSFNRRTPQLQDLLVPRPINKFLCKEFLLWLRGTLWIDYKVFILLPT